MGVGGHRCIVGIPPSVDHLSTQLVGGLSSHLLYTTTDLVREWNVFHIRLDCQEKMCALMELLCKYYMHALNKFKHI